MNYLTVIDRCHGQNVPKPILFSGCDQVFRNHILQNIIQTAAREQKALVILDNGDLLGLPILEAAGYNIVNGLGGEFALCDPFRVDTLQGMLHFRNLLGALGYSEVQKQALVQYLDFLSYVEGLDKPEGKPHITLELFGRYSTAAQTEARLQQLHQQGVISGQQQIHLLSKYAELSADAADFEKILYLLLMFVRGEQLALDTEGLAVVYPLKALDEDDFETLCECNKALEIFYDISEKGEALSVSNPQAKWDHRAYGGRFASMLEDCTLKDFPDIRTMRPFVLVTPEGKWIEPGRDAWWLGGLSAKEEDIDWRKEFSRIIGGYPETYRATVIDCHI